MVRHRCTRCKEDVGGKGIRHKFAGGLFCEKCLRELRGGPRVHRGIFSFFRNIWEMVVGFVSSPFRKLTTIKDRNRAIKVAYKATMVKAMDIPQDAQKGGIK